MTKQCPSCGGDCGYTRSKGCQYDSGPIFTVPELRDELQHKIDKLTAERDLLLEQMRSDRKQYLDMRDERNALKEACATHANTAPAQQLTDDHRQTIYANQCLVAALDRIHDVLNGVYVDDVAGIVNRALDANKELK